MRSIVLLIGALLLASASSVGAAVAPTPLFEPAACGFADVDPAWAEAPSSLRKIKGSPEAWTLFGSESYIPDSRMRRSPIQQLSERRARTRPFYAGQSERASRE